MEFVTDAFVNNERFWLFAGIGAVLFVLAIVIIVFAVSPLVRDKKQEGLLYKLCWIIIAVMLACGITDIWLNNIRQDRVKDELISDLTEAGYKDILIDEGVENLFPEATLNFKYPKNDELVDCTMIPAPVKDHQTFAITCFNK